MFNLVRLRWAGPVARVVRVGDRVHRCTQVPPVTARVRETLRWGPAAVSAGLVVTGTRGSSTGPCAASAGQWA